MRTSFASSGSSTWIGWIGVGSTAVMSAAFQRKWCAKCHGRFPDWRDRAKNQTWKPPQRRKRVWSLCSSGSWWLHVWQSAIENATCKCKAIFFAGELYGQVSSRTCKALSHCCPFSQAEMVALNIMRSCSILLPESRWSKTNNILSQAYILKAYIYTTVKLG